MSWIALAIVAAALTGLGNVGEKVLASRYMPDTASLMGWLALSVLGYGVVFAFLYPFAAGTPLGHIIAVFGSGVSFGVALSILYRAIRRSEASRAFPVFNSAPVFVAIIAVFALGQSVSALQWLAILLVVAGVVAISVERGKGGRPKLDSTFLWLLVAAGAVGLSQVLGSYALEEVTTQNAFWAQRFGALLPIALNWRRDSLRNFLSTARRPGDTVFALVTEAGVLPVAHLLMLEAFSKGPVSLVSATIATVPVWVFLFSTALSTRLWNVLSEPLKPGTLAIKAIAIGGIVAGVVGITYF